jgi:hypothetical protein
VVGDDHRDVHRDLPAPVPPQQIQQAVVGLGGEDRHPLRSLRVRQLPPQIEPRLERLRDSGLDPFTLGGEPRQVEDRALEELPTLDARGVLVQRDDVRPEPGQQLRDCGNNAVLIRAADDQPRDIARAGGVTWGCGRNSHSSP